VSELKSWTISPEVIFPPISSLLSSHLLRKPTTSTKLLAKSMPPITSRSLSTGDTINLTTLLVTFFLSVLSILIAVLTWRLHRSSMHQSKSSSIEISEYLLIGTSNKSYRNTFDTISPRRSARSRQADHIWAGIWDEDVVTEPMYLTNTLLLVVRLSNHARS
jgi:hypothetical protein